MSFQYKRELQEAKLIWQSLHRMTPHATERAPRDRTDGQTDRHIGKNSLRLVHSMQPNDWKLDCWIVPKSSVRFKVFILANKKLNLSNDVI